MCAGAGSRTTELIAAHRALRGRDNITTEDVG
jgi:hypothetical protein